MLPETMKQNKGESSSMKHVCGDKELLAFDVGPVKELTVVSQVPQEVGVV